MGEYISECVVVRCGHYAIASHLIFLFYFAICCHPNNSAWDKKTGPNAPLYDMEGGLPGFSVHSCVENWKAGGGLPDQM